MTANYNNMQQGKIPQNFGNIKTDKRRLANIRASNWPSNTSKQVAKLSAYLNKNTVKCFIVNNGCVHNKNNKLNILLCTLFCEPP